LTERSETDNWTSWRRKVDLDEYDERWRRMEAAGENPHGEADFVMAFQPARVLDGGCGTGRVGIELARRGVDVVGVDRDPDLLERARAKAPHGTWVLADLAELDLGRRFDVVVLAGNVVPYVESSRRPAAVGACAHHLHPGGRLVAGFQLRAGWPTLDEYDQWCASAGLVPGARYATWGRQPLAPPHTYVVTVHQRGGG
jgi:SAM-dependent methyltransferase